ncbi:hypothetical protein TNCV_2009031 [Trichonephila clavipes]|nr:hypothetical protein TNCV_2009031 [Trichonephila clavipes]
MFQNDTEDSTCRRAVKNKLKMSSLEMLTMAWCGVSLTKFLAAVAERSRYRIAVVLVTSLIPVPLKTHRVGQRCTLNLSRVQTSSRWCSVVVRRGGMPAQVSSMSLGYCSKLRGHSPKAIK